VIIPYWRFRTTCQLHLHGSRIHQEANQIGHILHRNCLLKHATEGKIKGRTEIMGRRGLRCKQLLDDLKGKNRIQEIERGSTRLHSVENSLWKRLWTCHKWDYEMTMNKLVVSISRQSKMSWQISHWKKDLFSKKFIFLINTLLLIQAIWTCMWLGFILQNSFNPAPTGPGRSWILKYSCLLDSI